MSVTPIESRSKIYDIFADPTEPVHERIQRGLETGTAYLDLPIGFFTRIEAGTQEIVRSVGDHALIQPGETCPLDRAYCRRTVEIESPLAIQNAPDSTAISDAAVETFDLGAYIGAKVVVDDEPYGTVCFANTETRETPFSKAESYFVELLARLAGQALEREAYRRELKEREDEVKTKEEVYRAVVDSSFDLVFQIDTDGRFTFVSSTIEELLGYPPEKYVGQPFTDVLPNRETVDLAEEVYEQVLAGETVEKEYFPLEHRTEDRVIVDIRVTPLFSGEVPPEDRTPADIVGVQGMARDATGRQRRQRMIRVLNRVLRHNLRNDMNIINGMAKLLEDRLAGENAEYVRKIVETGEELVSLGETARKLEKNLEAPPELAAVDVVPVVEEAADRIDDEYPGASITVDTPESAVARSATRLETAVVELLENAAKHAGEEPSIAVSVRVGDRVRIRIEDDGPGIPEQERAVLVSGEETSLVHGSGLGLWLVYWIVQSLDGILAVRGDTCVEIALERPNGE